MKIATLYRVVINSKDNYHCDRYSNLNIDEKIISPTHEFELGIPSTNIYRFDMADLSDRSGSSQIKCFIDRNGILEIKLERSIIINTLIEVVTPIESVIRDVVCTPTEVEFKMLYELQKKEPRLRYLFHLNVDQAKNKKNILNRTNTQIWINGVLLKDTDEFLNRVIRSGLGINKLENHVLLPIQPAQKNKSKANKTVSIIGFAEEKFIPFLIKVERHSPTTNNAFLDLIRLEFKKQPEFAQKYFFLKGDGSYNVSEISLALVDIFVTYNKDRKPPHPSNFTEIINEYLKIPKIRN